MASGMSYYIGGSQNYGAFLGPYYSTAPNIEGTQKGTTFLTTTHINIPIYPVFYLLKGGYNVEAPLVRVWGLRFGARVSSLGFDA